MITKESKIFFSFLLGILVLSVSYIYYDTIVLKHFNIFTTEEEIPAYIDLFEELKGFFTSNV